MAWRRSVPLPTAGWLAGTAPRSRDVTPPVHVSLAGNLPLPRVIHATTSTCLFPRRAHVMTALTFTLILGVCHCFAEKRSILEASGASDVCLFALLVVNAKIDSVAGLGSPN